MALGLYTEPKASKIISSDSSFTSSLSIAIDGKTGGEIAKKLYVRNDDLTRWYSSITLSTSDSSGRGLNAGNYGYSWKLYKTDQIPTLETWNTISSGNTITLDNLGNSSLGDTATYISFWVRVKIPRFAPIEQIRTVSIVISSTENFIV